MSNRIRLAISTCPNDTFAFHGLLHKKVDWRGIEFDIELLDIQQLNEGLKAGRFDVAKASFHAALMLADKTIVLPAGSALGFGVGPLLLSRKPSLEPINASQLTLCPGEDTTATLLFQLFYPRSTRLQHVLFSDIMPRLQAGRADFGVCIHEGRFTWQQAGLALVEDLGERWERTTQSPLPLGGILAMRHLPSDLLTSVSFSIRDSIEYGLANRQETLTTMRTYAQEFDDDVLMQHVDLYVNRWTIDLGDEGRRALSRMQELAVQAGIIDQQLATIEVFDVSQKSRVAT